MSAPPIHRAVHRAVHLACLMSHPGVPILEEARGRSSDVEREAMILPTHRLGGIIPRGALSVLHCACHAMAIIVVANTEYVQITPYIVAIRSIVYCTMEECKVATYPLEANVAFLSLGAILSNVASPLPVGVHKPPNTPPTR